MSDRDGAMCDVFSGLIIFSRINVSNSQWGEPLIFSTLARTTICHLPARSRALQYGGRGATAVAAGKILSSLKQVAQ